MSRVQWWLFNLLYLVFTALWVIALLFLNFASGASWPVKLAMTLALVVVTPTLDGPWRYDRYLRAWDSENGRG